MERESEPCRALGGHLLAVALPSARFGRPRTGPGTAHSCPDSESHTPDPRIAKLSGPAVRMPTSCRASWSPAPAPGTSRHVHNFFSQRNNSNPKAIASNFRSSNSTERPRRFGARLRPERRVRRITNVPKGAPEPASPRGLPTGRPSLARNSLATECKHIRGHGKITSRHRRATGRFRKKLQTQ